MTRDECKRRLQQDGEFLVRESTTKAGEYVLSARDRGALRHFIIQKTEDVSRYTIHESVVNDVAAMLFFVLGFVACYGNVM